MSMPYKSFLSTDPGHLDDDSSHAIQTDPTFFESHCINCNGPKKSKSNMGLGELTGEVRLVCNGRVSMASNLTIPTKQLSRLFASVR